ncbi:MAG: PstS family phosphate ABC transporter substrate-binding protein [Planctomycetaceae bacterium]|nr:PstS family phosphate ABC transporter substrate-binding protein [Planctomycetota bacterium]NUN53512.1 PstS family phosphate ABC transporter substrate-binding protein [Planctomycetaceae bacterium]
MNRALAAALALCLLVPACGGRSSNRAAIQNKGSDTLVNVAQAWAERYRDVKPEVAVSVTGGGSGVGISALINGNVEIANSSRSLKDSERAQAKAKGIEPVEFVVGHDALAVYVHRSNPLESITLAQLAEIYGEGGKIARWEDLGVTVPGAEGGKIVRVSRQNNSGTYEYFKEAVLGKREYALGSLDMQGSKDVVDLVARTPGSIGFSGLAYESDKVRVLKVSGGEGKPGVAPTVSTALDGTYPIARPLFMYTRGQPAGEVRAYLDWILSDAGQRIIQDKGYAPVRPLGGR